MRRHGHHHLPPPPPPPHLSPPPPPPLQLSEEHIKEMYRCFMLLYVDEYDDDTLDSLGLDEVDCHPMSN